MRRRRGTTLSRERVRAEGCAVLTIARRSVHRAVGAIGNAQNRSERRLRDHASRQPARRLDTAAWGGMCRLAALPSRCFAAVAARRRALGCSGSGRRASAVHIRCMNRTRYLCVVNGDGGRRQSARDLRRAVVDCDLPRAVAGCERSDRRRCAPTSTSLHELGGRSCKAPCDEADTHEGAECESPGDVRNAARSIRDIRAPEGRWRQHATGSAAARASCAREEQRPVVARQRRPAQWPALKGRVSDDAAGKGLRVVRRSRRCCSGRRLGRPPCCGADSRYRKAADQSRRTGRGRRRRGCG